MSGHSKWSTIKHQKGQTDVKRGQLFTKLSREITVSVKQGGGNSDANVRLRLAIQKARDGNMPISNIERAVKKALGQSDGQADLEEIIYEGYGPGGIAILVQVASDNKNRAISEVRTLFSRNDAALGASGSVSWQFDTMGVISIEAESESKAEEFALSAIDLGAKDFLQEGSFLEIQVALDSFDELQKAIESMGVTITSAEICQVPKSSVSVNEHDARKALGLLDRLEELDDVQKVYTNADFPETILQQYKTAA